jgi:S-adenosylmethionine:diacylglycerol 3-amino-3-carboxypropyl transferase
VQADADTVWESLDGVLFGRMHEDPELELQIFGAGKRVFAIASAGCTVRALAAAGHRVLALDINPRQLAYARTRAEGWPAVEGAAERLAGWGRAWLPLAGWNADRLHEFLNLQEVGEQIAYWREVLNTRRWRMAVDAALSRAALGWFYARSLTAVLPRPFGPCLRARLGRCCAIHPNRTNPYLRGLLRGDMPPEPDAAKHPIEWVCADAVAYLESCAPGSFDGFTLSNIGDGASGGYRQRLWAAVRRAAAPGAAAILRSFAEPRSTGEARWAAQDRSAIWGSIHVEQ